jgi:serine/threonine protein phosphatase PrpC
MIPVHAAGATDVGQVRANNQDSYHVGDSVFAVADGMGGHLAGEVASATALEPVMALDGRVYPDGETAVEALDEAVVEANRLVSTKAASDSSYRGMGTTLTVALFEGMRVHIGHVGDSRAYLLRDGQLQQVTSDHTLVQHLIDEGQITPEEAATHPQRSIVTRAIGVSGDVEVDTHTIDIRDGDSILLCSDGLTGHVGDDDLMTVLERGDDEKATLETLIAKANAAGGSDNITGVLLRFGDRPETADAAAPDEAADEEDAGARPVLVRSGDSSDDGDWAGRLGRFGSLTRESDDDPRAADGKRRWPAVVAAVLLVLVLAAGVGRWLLSRSYYVGLDERQVVIYQGVPLAVGPLELSWVVERSGLSADEVPSYYATSLAEGITALDRRDARLIIENATREYADADNDGSDPDDTATP